MRMKLECTFVITPIKEFNVLISSKAIILTYLTLV